MLYVWIFIQKMKKIMNLTFANCQYFDNFLYEAEKIQISKSSRFESDVIRLIEKLVDNVPENV